MRLAIIIKNRFRSLLYRPALDQELDEELPYHLDRQIDEYIAAGMTPHDARLAARKSMHGLQQRKEACKDLRGWNWFDNFNNDIRFSLRQLHKNPGFTISAILILALGIAASLAIFAFVDAALLKPLPYQHPERLLGVFGKVPTFPKNNLSYPDYLDWKKRNTSFSSLELYRSAGFNMSTSEGTLPVRAVRVSDGFFRTLGVAPRFGRDFYPGEDLPGMQRTLLLSHASWQNRYNSNPDILGKSVILDRETYLIIGVLPRDFHFAPARSPEFWINYQAEPGCDLRRGCHGSYGVGRLKDNVSIAAALANLTAIAAQLEKEYPDSNRDQGAAVEPLSEGIVGKVRPILLLLLAGAALLLVIAGVNVTGLLLVRSESRRREISVRTALGASTSRLLTQFLTEAAILTFAAGLIGTLCANWTMQLLVNLLSKDLRAAMPFLIDLGLSFRVVAFDLAICLLALILFSLAPCFTLWSSAIRAGLAEGSRASSGTAWQRVGSKLVVIELATAMILLVGAGLLGQSLYRLLAVDVGFEPNHLITMHISLPVSKYKGSDKRIAFNRQLLSLIQSLPGVTSVGFSTNGVPLGGNGNTTWLRILDRPWHGEHNETPERDISPGYLQTLGAKLVRGRYFEEAEDESRPPVAIINQAFARMHFPASDPIGKRISYLSNPPVPIEIVGIVENIREGELDAEIPAVFYRPFNQNTDTYFGLVIRTGHSESSMLPTISATLKQLDNEIVTREASTMVERINNSPSAYIGRTSALLVGAFATLALLLGMAGIYGVVAYSVSQRTREIGVRIALGAQPNNVYMLIFREAGWLTATGVFFGALAAIAVGNLLTRFLFGVRSWDPLTLAAAAIGLSFASVLACFIPARRAATVSPVEALRSE